MCDGDDIDVFHRIRLDVHDIVYDRTRGLLYGTTPSTVGELGNSVVAFDPASGEIAFHIPIGSTPEPLAISDDDSVLYVGLRGAHAIRAIDLETRTPRPMFPVGISDSGESLRAGEMRVVPGRPETLVVARRNAAWDGVLVVYDDGVMRPLGSSGPTRPYRIAVASDSVVYGYDDDGSHSFMTFAMNEMGLTLQSEVDSLIGGSEIVLADGLLYSTGGHLVDPSVPVLRARMLATGGMFGHPLIATGVAPDPATNRAYFIAREFGFGPLLLFAFDTRTYLEVGRVGVPDVVEDTTRLVRWGARGVAFLERSALENSERFLVILSTSLVLPP